MTSVVNRDACSAEYLSAFDALLAGSSVRRTSWPEGQFLRRKHDGQVAVFRKGATYSPTWQGPSGAESDADDWQIIQSDDKES